MHQGTLPGSSPSRRRGWLAVALIAALVVASATVGAILVRTGDAHVTAGMPVAVPAVTSTTVDVAVDQLRDEGYRCVDSLRQPPVHRCLAVDSANAVMVAVGLQSGAGGGVQRIEIHSFADKFYAFSKSSDSRDKAERRQSAARKNAARQAWKAVVPDVFGPDTTGWVRKVGTNGTADSAQASAAFQHAEPITTATVLPADTEMPSAPYYRKLPVHAEQVMNRLATRGFRCESNMRLECELADKRISPGLVRAAVGFVDSSVQFSANLDYTLSFDPDPSDDAPPRKVARVFTTILAAAGFSGAEAEKLVADSVLRGRSATADIDGINIFIATRKAASGKLEYASMQAQGIRW